MPYRRVLALAGCSVSWLKVELRDGSEVQFESSDVTAVVVEAEHWNRELG